MRKAIESQRAHGWLLSILAAVLFSLFSFHQVSAFPISSYAWSDAQWEEKCKGVRTSFNPDSELSNRELTLTPDDPRWLDFIYWAWHNKITEHQVEALGGTLWEGPKNGVIFHWAPGSRWETHTVASFGATVGHTMGEHAWVDTNFPDFFERRGGTYGALVKDRLYEMDPNSPRPWVEFLEYLGGPESPHYRFVFHHEAAIDPVRKKVIQIAGPGVAFEYSYERYLHELQQVLTDCKAFQFFQAYDRFGPGFAYAPGRDGNRVPGSALGAMTGNPTLRSMPPTPSDPFARPKKERHEPKGPEVGPELSEAKDLYNRECAVCHGIAGKGDGILAEYLLPKPRDLASGLYRIKSTPSGSLPTDEDIFRTISRGVPGTTMPGWSQFYPEKERWALGKYVKVLSSRFSEEKPEPAIQIGTPIAASPQSIALGRALYEALGCQECHGMGGKGDGPAAADLKDQRGEPVPATDLTNKWNFEGGHQPEDVYRTVMTGMDGSPMPSYSDSLPNVEDRWHLVNYVLSLSPRERPAVKSAGSRP